MEKFSGIKTSKDCYKDTPNYYVIKLKQRDEPVIGKFITSCSGEIGCIVREPFVNSDGAVQYGSRMVSEPDIEKILTK